MKKHIKLIGIITLLLIIIISGTYAFYSGRVNKSGDVTALFASKKLSVSFQDGPEIVLDGALPGQKVLKTFSVTNTGNTTVTYHLEFIDVINELTRNSDLVYTLTSTNDGAELSETIFPSEDGTFASNIEIPANTTQEYTMLIEYKNLDENQSIDMNSHIHATIQINEIVRNNTVGDSLLSIAKKNLGSGYYDFEVKGDNETITYPVHLIVLDGNQTIDSATTYGDLTDCASSADDMAHNMVIVKVNGDLTITSNGSIGPTYNEEYGGPKGFMLYVNGNIINNGTIDNSHGAYAAGENVYLWKNADNSFEVIPAVGSTGGASVRDGSNAVSGLQGVTATGRALAGGGSGGSWRELSGAGGTATSYSGGPGGGGAGRLYGEAGSNNGGKGGDASPDQGNQYDAGGAGNPGGIYYNSKEDYIAKNGDNGTGGLLIIYTHSLENNGSITANGSLGGEAYEACGGSSGGGSVNIFVTEHVNAHAATNVNAFYNNYLGNVDVSGGAKVVGRYADGGAGGTGTVNIGAIRNDTYYDLKDAIRQDIEINSQSIIINGDSILDIMNNNNNLNDGYWIFRINNTEEQYLVHLINLEGNQVITTDTNYGSLDDCALSNSDYEMAKAMVIVRVNGNYTVNSGVTVGPIYHELYGGPKGFMLYVTGTLTNNGTIDNSHGAYAEGENVYLWKNANGSYEYVPAVGGAGGESNGITDPSGNGNGTAGNGNAGIDGGNVALRALGGGGAGGGYYGKGGSGAAATSYSGGTGGGAGGRTTGEDGYLYGGKGGDGIPNDTSQYNGGGAGNPGGAHSYGASYNGDNGTGGLLIIYTNELVNNATISALGSNGGAGPDSTGGASGGGSINIFANTVTTRGIIDITGGTGGGGYRYVGGAGGSGTVNIGVINNGNYFDIEDINPITLDSTGLSLTSTGLAQKIIVRDAGTYKLELWGGQGGYRSSSDRGGKGGYASGTITLDANDVLYAYVGASGNNGGFNGGGTRPELTANGGGASDIRIATKSLYSRVIVAGGGGSDGCPTCSGGYAGGETGGAGSGSYGNVGGAGTQTAGGSLNGTFGVGGNGTTASGGYAGAGGGGWYGGGGATPDGGGDDDRAGGGGSSFVFTSSTTKIANYNVNDKYQLTDATLKAGNESMPTQDGTSTMTGNSGDGYIKITYIGS